MNKIYIFSSEISQQIQKMYEKSGHNYSNVAQSQILFYKHEKCIVPDNCTKYENNSPHPSPKQSQQTLKIYEKLPIITQICYRAKIFLHASAAHGT